jgi:hypothetical protein
MLAPVYNLDAFWSREPSTVSQNLGKTNLRALQIAHELGMSQNPPLPSLGPWKLHDEFGAGAAAIIMAKHSMDPGRCD